MSNSKMEGFKGPNQSDQYGLTAKMAQRPMGNALLKQQRPMISAADRGNEFQGFGGKSPDDSKGQGVVPQEDVLKAVRDAGLPLVGPNGNPMVAMDGRRIADGNLGWDQNELDTFIKNATNEYEAEFHPRSAPPKQAAIGDLFGGEKKDPLFSVQPQMTGGSGGTMGTVGAPYNQQPAQGFGAQLQGLNYQELMKKIMGGGGGLA